MRYKYRGRPDYLTFADGSGQIVFEGLALPGRDYDLPADNARVQALIAGGFLQEAVPAAKSRADLVKQDKKGKNNG
ncbi:hypothetical protein [Candidatus Tokpelaia sp.]|uniref:hypothetical protein n=1 Tax=Candidatus Tokpelaia sp. TaxID=2233777 RepID=UPI00123C712A|nr:hypothetical protein [Candidatus Tokpelaia sp.]KAA6404489.1 hypothetical protein DPQ22_09665 [Candidatus Tokpelaia sp.]